MNMYFYKSEIGEIGILENDGKITNLYFERGEIPKGIQICETTILREASQQLQRYFKGEIKKFSLSLEPAGTEFMRKVWESLCDIPYGKTSTYKEIAEKVGSPKAARAVGLACNRNPIPIIIPCHRVIGADGSLTGYRGGLELKKKLLELERI